MSTSPYSYEHRDEAREILRRKCPHNTDYALGVVEGMATQMDLDLVDTARLVAGLLPDPPEHRTVITFCREEQGS